LTDIVVKKKSTSKTLSSQIDQKLFKVAPREYYPGLVNDASLPSAPTTMASGERLTVTYAYPESGPLKVDIYCTVPPVDPIDPTPALDRLPFILFIHGGHFYTGSRRDVPPWLISLARSLGTPLLCMDYRLAPHAGPSHAFEDLQNLWHFIQTDLPLMIASTGRGAGVESGTEALEDDFIDLQNRGGIDPARAIIVGLGAGGYLAALGGAYLSPPPLALVLGYPTLEFDSQTGKDSTSNIPDQFRAYLGEHVVGDTSKAKHAIPDMPMLLERAPYASNIREATGMNMEENWSGRDESIRRKGLVDYLLKTDQWGPSLRKASPNAESGLQMLNSEKRCNRPYPPCLIFHGIEDTRISYKSSQNFIASIRKAEPVAAAVDALSQPVTFSKTSVDKSEDSNSSVSFKSTVTNVNETGRYIFLGIQGPGAGHAFDALLPRMLSTLPYTRKSSKVMGDRYRSGMIHIDYFVKHWLEEGSMKAAAVQNIERSTSGNIVQDGNIASRPRRAGSRL
jgi:acetyl esterase/lipase